MHAVGPGFVVDHSGVAALLDDWRKKLAAKPHETAETDSPSPKKQGEVGRQQQHINLLGLYNYYNFH